MQLPPQPAQNRLLFCDDHAVGSRWLSAGPNLIPHLRTAHRAHGTADLQRPFSCQQSTLHCSRYRRNVQTNASAEAQSSDGWFSRYDIRKWRASSLLNTEYDKDIVALAIPSLLSMLLDPIMGAINTALVGHLGTQSLAAVSIGSMVMTFATVLFSFMLVLITPRVAAAVATDDMAQASKTASMGLWISGVCGLLMSTAVFSNAGRIMAALNPAEASVAHSAVLYIMGRCVGLTATVLNYTCSGIYRGFKDTRTPLYATVFCALVSVPLNLLLIYGFKFGVLGAAMATSTLTWAACGIQLTLLIRKGRVKVADLAVPPSFQDALPILQSGVLLSMKNIVAYGLVLYATSLCVRAGAVVQSAFEVVKQIWMLSTQCFECLSVACNSLCASYLGASDWRKAKDVLVRVSFLGTTIASIAGLVLMAIHVPAIKLFTTDINVQLQVQRTIPMLCLTFPFEAITNILDGSLFASRQTNYITFVQMSGAVALYIALLAIINFGTVEALSVWSALKVMTVVRLVAGFHRVFISDKSAYRPQPAAP